MNMKRQKTTWFSKLCHRTYGSNQSLVNIGELDSMESTVKETYEDDDVEVFMMKKQHFQAAKKFFVDLNLAKYSVEKGNEFEIKLNKTSERSIISQIKDFTSEEIPISNYEMSLSAKSELSKNYSNVHVSISRSSLLLYGLRKEVSSAKLDLLAQLGIPDEINMGMNDGTVNSFGGKPAGGHRSQEKESDVKQTESHTSNDKRINGDDGKVSTPVESTSVDNTSVVNTSVESTYVDSSSAGSAFVRRNEREMCETSGPGHSHELKQTRTQFYAGPKTNLKVYVRKENITKLDVDIIVNAANGHLRHGGGVAKAIASAAGRSLKNECNSHINTNGPLEVTDVYVSTGGLLNVKYVMHAVGPRWVDYPDKDRCLTELRRTVVRCLVEASRLKKASIALPSISAAIFKVPQELCAQCYMEAVKSFDDFADELGVVPVKDIWFVDVDDVMVNTIQEKFTNEWHKPVDEKIAKEDLELAQLHLSKKRDDKFDGSAIKKKDQRKLSHGMKLLDESNVMFPQEDISTTISYQINSIQISIVTKPATDYRSTIVVVGKLFDELTGLKELNVKYSAKPRSDLPMQKGAFKYLSLAKPDGSRSTLICQLHPNPDSPDDVTKALGNLDNAKEIHKSNTVIFTSAIFYAKSKQGKNNFKIISKFAIKLFDFAAAISSSDSAIKSILIATGAGYIPQVIEIFEERNLSTIPPGQRSRGKQPPNGAMDCSHSPLDVQGCERKGSLEINYHIPDGVQTEELQHPSPGKPFQSVTRTAYLPATDDGYSALRLLRVAFHRRLIFTIDVSQTTRMEGIVWNIHHKTSRNSSTNGSPDPTYLSSLMEELRQNGVTEESMTVEEKKLVEKLMESLSRKKEAVCRVC